MKNNEEMLQKLEIVGLKTTQQRLAVLEEAIALEHHFDAEELSMRLRNRGIRASRATVYRTLAALSAGGLIREVHSDDLHSHYELVKNDAHHDHLICQVCGAVEEFSDPQIEELQDKLCETRGFEPFRHRLEIVGVCQSCREKKTGAAENFGDPS